MIRIGVGGAGGWGRNLLRAVNACPSVELTAIADSDGAALATALSLYPGANGHAGFASMLEDDSLDAVIVATPPSCHFEHASAALDRNLHVLVEKPMATRAVEADWLNSHACKASRVLMVGHTFLYSNLVHEVKRRIDSGELGDVLCIHSQRLNLGRVREDVDALWNFAPHDISILNYLLDDWPTHVNARGHGLIHRNREVADVAFFQMEFAPSASGVAPVMGGHVSWLDPQKVRRLVVVGSEKMLVYDDVDTQRHIQIYDKSVEMEFQSAPGDFCEFKAKVRAGELVVPNITLVEPLSVEIEHFAECIRTAKSPLTNGDHATRTVQVLEALSTSMRHGGGRVDVSYEVARPHSVCLTRPLAREVVTSASVPSPGREASADAVGVTANSASR